MIYTQLKTILYRNLMSNQKLLSVIRQASKNHNKKFIEKILITDQKK
jgi:hypothetical protein